MNNEIITLDRAIELVPAIAADTHTDMASERYRQIRTLDVLERMQDAGWGITQVSARVSRKQNPIHAKHLVRMRHDDLIVGDSAIELLVINSHDRTASLQFMIGMYRFVCANGLVTGDTFQKIRTIHAGEVNTMVDMAIEHVHRAAPAIADRVDTFRGISCDPVDYADRAAHELIVPRLEKAGKKIVNYDEFVERLAHTRRPEDRDGTLWAAYNTVQENIIRGGVAYTIDTGRTKDGAKVIRGARLKGTKNIDTNVSINKTLWDIAENLAVAA